MKTGKILQIIGPVVDVEFEEGERLPALFNALKVAGPNGEVILEVVKHLDLTKVKAISLASTDGLKRGLDVEDTGEQISVPVGPEVLGNLFNVLGQPLNENSKFEIRNSRRDGQSTGLRRLLQNRQLKQKFLKQESKLLT